MAVAAAAAVMGAASSVSAGPNDIIVPGPGFTGPTPQPEAVGRPARPGIDAKVIGQWDIVPFQTFAGNLEIGVVAFHLNGIDRVEFSADGGPWTAVEEMTLNPRTNVVEYWAVLRASDLDDGAVEVRAIAYPKYAGIPRIISYHYTFNGGPVVPSLTLYANADGGLASQVRYVSPSGSNSNNGLTPGTAYATIGHAATQIQSAQGGDAGGGTIYLAAHNNWVLPNLGGINAANRWLTIAGAPGTTPTQVVFTSLGYNGLTNGLLHIKNVKVLGPNNEFGAQGGGLWVQGFTYAGADPSLDDGGLCSVSANKPKGIYCTEANYTTCRIPLVKVTLARNLVMDDIGDDLLREPRTVINLTCTNHGTNGDSSFHADFVHWYLPGYYNGDENFIIYNVVDYKADSGLQGIYHDATGGWPILDNVAFVNVHIDRVSSTSSTSQWRSCPSNHLLLWHVTHDKLQFLHASPGLTNLSVRGCCWHKFTMSPGTAPDSAFANNHYIDAVSWQAYSGGVDATTGSPGWVNPSANDYRPNASSPLRNRLSPLLTLVDAEGDLRQTPGDVGPFED